MRRSVILDLSNKGCGCLWGFFILSIVIFGIWWSVSHPPQVAINTHGFASDHSDVGEGGSFTFMNEASFPITLCLGSRQDCNAKADGHSELRNPGLLIPPHQSKKVTFDTAGDYTVTLRKFAGDRIDIGDCTIPVSEQSDN